MGTRYNRLEAVLTSTHNLCFEQKYEKHQSFCLENFQFLEVKFFIYLNRRVFVMMYDKSNQCTFEMVIFQLFTVMSHVLSHRTALVLPKYLILLVTLSTVIYCYTDNF